MLLAVGFEPGVIETCPGKFHDRPSAIECAMAAIRPGSISGDQDGSTMSAVMIWEVSRGLSHKPFSEEIGRMSLVVVPGWFGAATM